MPAIATRTIGRPPDELDPPAIPASVDGGVTLGVPVSASTVPSVGVGKCGSRPSGVRGSASARSGACGSGSGSASARSEACRSASAGRRDLRRGGRRDLRRGRRRDLRRGGRRDLRRRGRRGGRAVAGVAQRQDATVDRVGEADKRLRTIGHDQVLDPALDVAGCLERPCTREVGRQGARRCIRARVDKHPGDLAGAGRDVRATGAAGAQWSPCPSELTFVWLPVWARTAVGAMSAAPRRAAAASRPSDLDLVFISIPDSLCSPGPRSGRPIGRSAPLPHQYY